VQIKSVSQSVMNMKNFSTYLCSMLCNKLPELHSLLYHETRDIILITETWLNGDIPNGLLDPEGKFHIFLHDRKERRGGGVCVLTRREHAFNIPVSDSYSVIELLCVDIAYCNAKCRIIVICRSTDIIQHSDMCTKQLVQCLEHLACSVLVIRASKCTYH